MSSFISQNLTEIEAVAGCTFACACHIVFRMFSCLQINWQPFYLRQLLKFHPFDWLIEIYLQTEGQGTHHKMVSLQPMPGFSPLFTELSRVTSQSQKTQCYSTDDQPNCFVTVFYYHKSILVSVSSWPLLIIELVPRVVPARLIIR